MAHFAKLDENNIVLEVNVVNNDDVRNLPFPESEAIGVAFLTLWSNGYTSWKQTSYNASFRKNYAGIGYTYDSTRDAFIAPQPYPSWTLNEDTCQWEPPVPMPIDGKQYYWGEPTTSWIEVTE
jgi:hypothetical protein